MRRLLLVEDEDVILKALKRLLERNHYEVNTASSVPEALAAQPRNFDLVLADLRLPGAAGTDIIPEANPVPVIIMTSHASVRSAVDAMRHGAIDYIAKPFDHDELLMVIERALAQNLLQAQNRALRQDMERLCGLHQHIEGTALEVLRDAILKEQETHGYLHICGERGSGRELLARSVHTSGRRSDAPFVVHEASSEYTLSIHELAMYLQSAQNGTLVLRHPEKLNLEIQKRLLHALNPMSTSGLEGLRSRRNPNGSVILISHQSIEQLTENGALVPELASLFSGNQHAVPPLRDRPQDTLLMAKRQLAALQIRHGREGLKFNDDAEAAIQANEWPGNMSELDNVLNRAFFVARNNTLTEEDLGFSPHDVAGRDMSLDEYFRYFVLRNQNNLSETDIASRLGISRKALWERRQRMHLLRESSD